MSLISRDERISDNHGPRDDLDNIGRGADPRRPKRREVGEASSPAAPERPTKRMKRGRYISRACASCQQRKIKCEGGSPCIHCVSKKRQCVPASSGDRQATGDHKNADGNDSGQYDVQNSRNLGESLANRDILARLAEVEHQLSIMKASTHQCSILQKGREDTGGSDCTCDQPRSTSAKLQNALELDGQTFGAEPSLSRALEDEGVGLDEVNDALTPCLTTGYPSTMQATPRTNPSSEELEVREPRGWLQSILTRHGVTADDQKWRDYMEVYLEEVHAIYPCLHPPALWHTLHEMWEYTALWPMTDSAEREQKRISVALVCFCLALGRACISTRMTDATGIHSSGWSLYMVGMSLMQDVMEMSNTTTKSLVTVHALIVRMMYLFRLDANQRAAQVLALTTSIAHAIGMHRQSTYERMPAFLSQLYCRTWWVIYVLDRRIAIESGNPYIIQDSSMDTALPLNLNEDWMTQFAARKETATDLQREIATEIARDVPPSYTSYLVAMIRYSRVVAKVWDDLYGVQGPRTTSYALVEYVDRTLGKLLENVPSHLLYDPEVCSDALFKARPRWQIKQTLLLFTCCTYLRVLIRRPFLPVSQGPNRTEDDDFESSTVCVSLAATVLNAQQCMKDDRMKYGFALSHYITSLAMVMIGMIAREPGYNWRYGDLTLAATRCLRIYCHKSWVSGKMMRWVSRLSQLVHRTLAHEVPDSQRRRSLRNAQRQLGIGTGEFRASRQIHQNSFTSDVDATELIGTSSRRDESSRKEEGSALSYDGNVTIGSLTKEAAKEGHSENLSATEFTVDRDSRREMPSWVMSDFNFETMNDFGEGLGPDKISSATGFSSLFKSDRRELARLENPATNLFVDDSRAGASGWSSVIDLDSDLDFSVMGTFDAAQMLDFDTLW